MSHPPTLKTSTAKLAVSRPGCRAPANPNMQRGTGCHHDQHSTSSPFRSKRLRTEGQLPPVDKNGHLSARFCVMRRERRRLLDLSMRVTVYNPLTASSYWRMAAVLTELRHDAVIGRPGTQKRVAVDAPPVSRTNSTEHGVFYGDFDVVLTSQTEVLVCRCSSRLAGSDKDIGDGYGCPPLPLSGRCGAVVVKKTVSDISVSLFSSCPPSHLEGVKQHLGGKRWMLCTKGLLDYSRLFQHVACRC